MADNTLVELSAQGILAYLSTQREQLKQWGVQKLGLFGSRGRDDAHTGSDMDFLVVLSPKTFDNYMNLKFFLEDTFGCPVDLVLEHTLRPELRPSVLAEVQYVTGL